MAVIDKRQKVYNDTIEKIVNYLQLKTNNYDEHFFRQQTLFFCSLIPSVMGAKVRSKLTGTVPINTYALSCMPSGSGKGFSTNILENTLLGDFRDAFTRDIMPISAEENIQYMANMTGSDVDELRDDYESLGNYIFYTDSATMPAIKQLRNKLIMANCGAMNIIIDEIGMNLEGSIEPLKAFLELYDKGEIKPKLLKNVKEGKRLMDMKGTSPANLLAFGAPSKLFDGGATEDNLYTLLQTGYARRFFFAYSKPKKGDQVLTPKEVYDRLSSKENDLFVQNTAEKFKNFASSEYLNKIITINRENEEYLIAYKMECESKAELLNDYEEIAKSELIHRYFKAFKLAGALAFLDNANQIERKHLDQAITFTEDSGEAVNKILNREKPYVKLAKYITSKNGEEITLVDLSDDLIFFKGNTATKKEMINMATAWGYKNHSVIKRYERDGIEFFSGETLKETNLNKEVIFSFSKDVANDYINSDNYLHENSRINLNINWFAEVIKRPDLHWINHHSIDGHRSSEKMCEGFNLIVLDIDGGESIKNVTNILSDYYYIIHTTKRHGMVDSTTGNTLERFRLIIPMNYHLKLNRDDYKKFLINVLDYLPIHGVDLSTFQPERKWSCAPQNAQFFYNPSGELFDVLPFIPKTSRNDVHKKNNNLTSKDINKLEKWFIDKANTGERNNTLFRYGKILCDAGNSYDHVCRSIENLNNNLDNPLHKNELQFTIFNSLKKEYESSYEY